MKQNRLSSENHILFCLFWGSKDVVVWLLLQNIWGLNELETAPELSVVLKSTAFLNHRDEIYNLS